MANYSDRLAVAEQVLSDFINGKCNVKKVESVLSMVLSNCNFYNRKNTYEVTIIKNDRTKEPFFGARVYPALDLLDKIVNEIVVEYHPFKDIRTAWQRIDHWVIELDSGMFNRDIISLLPKEIMAAIMHEIGHTVYSDKVLERFYRSYKYMYVHMKNAEKDTLKLCPFPLQASCRESRRMSKKEARRLLGLDEDVFTLQVNFGGEGVGATDLLAALKDIDTPMQVLVIGGIEDRMKTELERIVRTLPENIDVRIVGFVANVNDYLLSCDIIAGRSGINTLVEAFYLRRPFLITELVYTVIASADYVEKYKVGWNASHDVARQLEIIRTYSSNPALLDEMDHNFDLIPMEYDASALAKMVVDDAQSYRTKTRTHG